MKNSGRLPLVGCNADILSVAAAQLQQSLAGSQRLRVTDAGVADIVELEERTGRSRAAQPAVQ